MNSILPGIFFVFLTACLSVNGFSQDDPEIKSTVIGDPTGRTLSGTITADANGNYYTAATENDLGLLVKQDALHNIIWKRNFTFPGSSYSIHPTSLSVIGDTLFGCGFVAQSNIKHGGFYFKVNAQTGSVYWLKSDLTSSGYFNAMRYSNGKYLLTGGFTAPNSTYRGKVLAVSSQDGGLIWETNSLRFEFPTLSQGFRIDFNQATEVINGTMYIVGTAESHGTPSPNISRVILIGIDELSGAVVLKKQFVFANSQFDKGQNIAFDGTNLVITYNNAYWLIGNSSFYGLIKCDLQGNVIFSRSYQMQGNSDAFVSHLNVTNTSYVLFGTLYWTENGAFMLKISQSGVFEECRLIYKPGMEYTSGSSLFHDLDGGTSTFINGKHYFTGNQLPFLANPWAVHQIIVDEDLNIPSDDCAANMPGTQVTIDVPVTTDDLVLVELAAPMTFQDAYNLSDPGTLIVCDGIALSPSQQATCTGASVTANATGFTNPSYYWSNGDSGDSISVTTEDSLFLTVIDVNCCKLIDTIVPVINTYQLTVSLPADTIICSQPGGFYTLVPTVSGPNAPTYVWSNGSGFSSLVVNSSGTYWVDVSDSCFTVRDSIVIQFRPQPVITYTPTVSTCENSFPLSLNPTITPGTAISWSDGVTTTSNIMVSAPGSYTVTATNNCGSVSHTIIVSALPLPDVTLTPQIDTCIQNGDAITLTPVAVNATSLSWSDGSSANSLDVNASGTYTVYATNQCGTDSAVCLVALNFFPELQLPAVLDTCFDETAGFYFTAQGTPGNYLWSNGTNAATTWINQTGIYTCTLSNACGSVSGQMLVNRASTISLSFPEDSILICAHSMNTSDFLIETNYEFELFYDGELVEDPTIEQSGWYAIHAFNDCASAWDSIFVNMQNEQFFYLPNSFTPNADEFNQTFGFKGENVVVREVRIFNRWGEEIFSEERNFTGWDGSYNGAPCPDGVYAVHVIYEDCFGIPVAYEGHVNLLR